ncbi:MAG: SDR family oxidoreductase [Pseudonocardiaceae bacterium]
MTILVTGATGALGRLVVSHLLEVVGPSEFAVSARDPGRATDLADAGVDVRKADFDDLASLDAAFADVRRLLVISTGSLDDDVRIQQHTNALDAAARAGVEHLAYTSVIDAQTSPLKLAAAHRETERLIRGSGIAFTFLRNGLYHEPFVGLLGQALRHGALVTSAGAGRIATASRDDLALAAATVLSTPGHEGAVYELTGPRAWSFDELAQIPAAHAGRPLVHTSVSDEALTAILTGAGLPAVAAGMFVDVNANIRAGLLAEVSQDLAGLIGRSRTSIETAVAAALESQGGAAPS